MTLLQGETGKTYTVVSTTLERIVETRLEVLGLTEGTKVQVLNRKRNGAAILKIRGTRLAVGKRISAGIDVNEVR